LRTESDGHRYWNRRNRFDLNRMGHFGRPLDPLLRLLEQPHTARRECALLVPIHRAWVGFGLPLCQSIVLTNHGIIRVESKVGHGTTVTICLPAWSEKPLHENSAVAQ
jgi:signal transduction histidine kinase